MLKSRISGFFFRKNRGGGVGGMRKGKKVFWGLLVMMMVMGLGLGKGGGEGGRWWEREREGDGSEGGEGGREMVGEGKRRGREDEERGGKEGEIQQISFHH